MERERLVLLMLSAINGLRRLSDGFNLLYMHFILLITVFLFVFYFVFN